jgi:ribonuclease HI
VATVSTWEVPHTKVAEDSEFMGIQTNNVAEYAGMILGLRLAQAHGLIRVQVRRDSRLVINQIAHGWACRKLSLIRLQGIARRLLVDFADEVTLPGRVRTEQMRGQVGHRSDTELERAVYPTGDAFSRNARASEWRGSVGPERSH